MSSFRSKFDMELDKLIGKLVKMGSAVESVIKLVTTALTERDEELAKKVIEIEEEINTFERDIERLCIDLLLQQSPVAGDLRMISACMKMITDMERIGDQASDIADIFLSISNDEYIMEPAPFREMGDIAIKMVHDSIEAFINNNVALARSVLSLDDKIDACFSQIIDRLHELMVADVNNNSRQALDLLMISKYYERIGDHAENISEWVIFSITGEGKDDL